MTAEELQEIERLDREATPGPWEIEREDCYEPDFDDQEPLGYPCRIGPIESWDHTRGGQGTKESAAIVEADAAFIARARTLLPRLAADYRAAITLTEHIQADLEARTQELDALRRAINAERDELKAAVLAHRAAVEAGLATTAYDRAREMWALAAAK